MNIAFKEVGHIPSGLKYSEWKKYKTTWWWVSRKKWLQTCEANKAIFNKQILNNAHIKLQKISSDSE